ncbi:MAG: copper amine oxidase protein [uncultured bacterium (gcode 4)]|uniref:Copper amine oxidase protein n=1 Tax=uncultured bacterium (gcode 4) TaxID=1234023 RepID=K2GG02_9BACT|nr:MAG: copper amine oxidase protein [uncultured bacterium (gcode 4)]
MKKTLLSILLLLPLTVSANTLVDTTISWHKIKAIKIIKNTWFKIIVWISWSWESLESMVTRYGWVSWINWAYFCPADYKDQCPAWNKSYADRISNSFDWSYAKDDTWPERVIFALDVNQDPFLFQKAHDYSKWRNDEFLVGKTINFDRRWDIYNWIGNHPLLLENGISKINESWAIDAKMKSVSLKNFICSTQDGNTIYMWWIEWVTIYQVPDILKSLGCYNAVNMDSGGSTAMVHNWKYVRWPGRNIMDAWIVIPDKNYPAKIAVNEDPVTKRAAEKLKLQLDERLASLDDFTKKQKYFALSSRLWQMARALPVESKKRRLLEGLKNEIDRTIQ